MVKNWIVDRYTARDFTVYNFGGYQEHLQQTSKSDESRSKVASDYSINYGLFYNI